MENTLAASTESAPVAEVVVVSPVNLPESGTGAAPELNNDGTPKEVSGAAPAELGNEGKGIVDEIKHVRKRAQTAEAEVAYWRGLAEGRGSKPAEFPAPTESIIEVAPVPPTVDKFETYESFEVAREKYIVNLAKWELKQELKQEEEGRKKTAVEGKWVTQVAAAQKKYKDFNTVVFNPAFGQSDVVAFLVKDSEMGTDLAYYLGTHLDEANRLNGLPPHVTAKEIGKIEAILATPKPVAEKKVVSMAPEPITTVGAKGGGEVDEQDLPIDEFTKRRNERQFQRKSAA